MYLGIGDAQGGPRWEISTNRPPRAGTPVGRHVRFAGNKLFMIKGPLGLTPDSIRACAMPNRLLVALWVSVLVVSASQEANLDASSLDSANSAEPQLLQALLEEKEVLA